MGSTVEEANEREDVKGIFTIEVVGTLNDDHFQPGQIVQQDPTDGAERRSNFVIQVYVCAEREEITMPDLLGNVYQNAKVKLQQYDLNLRVTREEAFSDEFPAGQIMETSPARGTFLKKNDSVVLTVSKGPESITVISFVGMTYTQAKAQAEELGLKVGAPEYRYYDPTAREGDVIEQSIAPSTTVQGGTEIIFTVYGSSGDQPQTIRVQFIVPDEVSGEDTIRVEFILDDVVVEKLKLDVPPADLTEWKGVVSRIATRSKTCTIALVGKYVKLHDAYLSVMESLYHAGFENDSQVEIKWVESEDLIDQDACKEVFADVDGIIVPGGFGDRGIEGMIQAAQYARENQIPYFGICLGMQIMVMEFARGVLGYADANSSEFTPDGAHNVIALMADQQGNIPKGGTMRLGKYPCTVLPGTKMAECYGQSEIWERHRHRYEFNNDFRDDFTDAGMRLAGLSPDGTLVEIVESKSHPWFVGAQFHPEFKSRPNKPHPLFRGFVAASLDRAVH